MFIDADEAQGREKEQEVNRIKIEGNAVCLPSPFLSLSLFIFLHFLLFAVCFQRVCVQVRWQWFSICRNSRSQLVLSADQGYLPEPRLPRTPSYPFPSPFPLSDISSFLNGSAPETNAELMLWLTSPATMDAAWTWPQLHWLPHSLTHRHSHANQYQYVRDVICICVNFPCTPVPIPLVFTARMPIAVIF